MAMFNSGFFVCSICGSDLELKGKFGAMLQTRCPGCGISSKDFNHEQQSGPQKVEVYYNRSNRSKAPASIPSPG